MPQRTAKCCHLSPLTSWGHNKAKTEHSRGGGAAFCAASPGTRWDPSRDPSKYAPLASRKTFPWVGDPVSVDSKWRNYCVKFFSCCCSFSPCFSACFYPCFYPLLLLLLLFWVMSPSLDSVPRRTTWDTLRTPSQASLSLSLALSEVCAWLPFVSPLPLSPPSTRSRHLKGHILHLSVEFARAASS